MKNLNSIIKDLKSGALGVVELDREQVKMLNGEGYSTKSECEADCFSGSNSSFKYWKDKSKCYLLGSGWECVES
ncbi:hypothetical protein MHTCC0001_00160 [Flavobacteriaceae bacterium MHTCC 0001]